DGYMLEIGGSDEIIARLPEWMRRGVQRKSERYSLAHEFLALCWGECPIFVRHGRKWTTKVVTTLHTAVY
ncbi:MAG: hypothetical protein NTV38_08180, partial [Chloroflexi bacterium]|nr:hypothetical protein [Chloroflexota bacterium]